MNTTATALQTVPVAGDAMRAGHRGHIIAVDGVIATITSINRADNGEHVVNWQQIDCSPHDEPATGTIYVPDGATVDCIRVADWLAREDSEASR
ncbi:hypothetical protein E1286_24110 [Nonomuraea terrae]|uniref:Uncharacterized protein n=1 Tax=Nonomuraea terrae TaxID=2530383 RepID=A0A4R4YKC0_9ACTN|nr:hypothetical protein [Nonomuraea terrae]TDD45405.1 hypothetical protein E1286_24110 [Nonomuraea terrae]